MTFPVELNRRHKAALFLTLVAAGVSLVLGADAKQTAGVALLGVAFAWAFGSNSRFVHLLFAVFGLALLAGPLAFHWYSYRISTNKYQEQVAEFERKIPELASRYPNHFEIVENGKVRIGIRRVGAPIASADELDGFLRDFPVYTPTGRWAVLEDIRRNRTTVNEIFTLRLHADSEKEHYLLLDVLLRPDFWVSRPQWYADARAAKIDLAAVPEDEKPGNPPRPFRVWEATKQSWIFEVPGLMLLITGLGLFFGVKGARKRFRSIAAEDEFRAR